MGIKNWEMKKFKFYTKEQEEKIERLCMEAEAEREKKRDKERSNTACSDLEVGSPVFVTLESKTISGYVMAKDGDLFEVKTPLGRIKNVKKESLRWRFVEDVSKVEIPAELKKCSNRTLLLMMSSFRAGCSSYWRPPFTESQVKAELRLRPHVTTKGERKTFKKYTN